MPIDPTALRTRAAALSEHVADPPLLARKVRGILEDYAERTYRLSPRLVGKVPTNALKTPAPVTRAIVMALRDVAPPAALLNLVREIWAGGTHEERHIAAELLGYAAPRASEKTLMLVEASLPDLESAETADALAEHGLGPLIRMNPAAYIGYAKHWAQSKHKWTRRFGLAVLQPLLKDKKWDSVPGALEVVEQVMADPDADVRTAAVETLRALIPKSPVEVGRFLRLQGDSANHNTQTIIRLSLVKLPPELRAEVEKVMRVA